MGLDKYREMRDFDRTPEPRGRARERTAGRQFVVQKHAARRLHYDFRLELGGVLLSWAVPKGPSLDPSVKRLAMRTEDHPLEYADFEGVIPKGEYGGGTVVSWDRGTWTPLDDPRAGERKGHLRFTLHGTKLRGEWHLVRTAPDKSGKERWLLFKAADEAADPGRDVTADARSVMTGRSLAEVAEEADRVWDREGERPGKNGGPPPPDASELPGAHAETLPERLEPELATLVQTAPPGEGWLHEIKYDGYRALIRIAGGEARAFSRRGLDWTDRFRPICTAAARLPVSDAWLDGELVVEGEDGRTDFQLLQNDLGAGRTDRLSFLAFDLPYLDGNDLRDTPLERRKALLEALLSSAGAGPLRYSRHVVGQGPEFRAEACRLNLEGIVSKRREAPYRGRRTRDWLKIKCLRRDSFVVGGYTRPSGARVGLGALLVGFRGEGGLRYAGRVGTGFTDRTLRALTDRLARLQTSASPFADAVPRSHARGAVWVRPELVAEVEYTELTRDGSLRHPSFKGLREDVDPDAVGRPEAAGAPQARPTAVAKASRKRTSERAARSTRAGRAAAKSARSPARGNGRSGRVEVAGVRLTTPERSMFPELGVTKHDLARFYEAHAERVLAHVGHRPLTLLRCPEGRGGKCFFQKHARSNIPQTVRRVAVEERGGPAEYLYVDSVEGLVTLVQMNFLEIHPWGARVDRLDRPDRLVLDLDPDPSLPWSRVAEAARFVRALLAELGLESFCKTTGGKGLHVVVPIDRRTAWDEAKAFTRALAHALARGHPDRYTDVSTLKRRTGRVFIDYLRNAPGATSVAAYTARARPGGPLSAPVAWDELDEIRPDAITVANLDARLARLKTDPWEGFGSVRQSITRPMRRRLGLD